MQTPFRDPQVEESTHAIILQNRCGNRLSLLIFDDRTDLEFVYKPNAMRRKEYRARNFSSRDNFTTLFGKVTALEISAPNVAQFEYDPFVTRLATMAPSGAANRITFVNVADENCFAIAARAPLTLTLKPHERFNVEEGLIYEQFSDRGEEIVSFIAFPGIEENRYRRLDDGTHVLQLLENDVILIGGEENPYQVRRAIAALKAFNLTALIERNEKIIAATLDRAHVHSNDDLVQRVLDINKRFTWSALDAGGACFGALNRIYHLIWTRDGSMSNAQYAMAGLPQFIETWAPFLMRNPAKIREGERTITAWQQLFGTRWTKSEDDGLFYATWSLYTHVMTTGSDTLLREECFALLLKGLDDALATRLDKELGLFVSDTRGESSLASSPYYGYDIVNGQMDTHRVGTQESGRVLSRAVSLYNNILQYNVLRMVTLLLEQLPDTWELQQRYSGLARELREQINGFFIDQNGRYRSEYLYYTDGSEGYAAANQIDWWEYAWSLSLTPFHPDISAAVTSARDYVQYWPTQRHYGFCPWNTLVALLHEHGLPAKSARSMLQSEISEALMLTKKYPMPGLLTEYLEQTEGWRGLPFSASSFNLTLTAMLLKPMPRGLAVRAGGLVDRIHDFCWMNHRLDVITAGNGEEVTGLVINGEAVPGTLQLPQSLLVPGRNRVEVQRGATWRGTRLAGSTLLLLSAAEANGEITLRFAPTMMGEVTLEHAGKSLRMFTSAGKELAPVFVDIPGTRLRVYYVEPTDGLVISFPSGQDV